MAVVVAKGAFYRVPRKPGKAEEAEPSEGRQIVLLACCRRWPSVEAGSKLGEQSTPDGSIAAAGRAMGGTAAVGPRYGWYSW